MSAADDGDEDDQAHEPGDATDYQPVLSLVRGQRPAEDRRMMEYCHYCHSDSPSWLLIGASLTSHIEHEEGEHSEGDSELENIEN